MISSLACCFSLNEAGNVRNACRLVVLAMKDSIETLDVVGICISPKSNGIAARVTSKSRSTVSPVRSLLELARFTW